MAARPRRCTILDKLTYSECEASIRQSRLGWEDEEIARMYLLEREPQVEIADVLRIARNTISRRLPRIEERVLNAAKRMGYI